MDKDTRLEPPELVSIRVDYDPDAESPRSWDNICTITSVETNSDLSRISDDAGFDALWWDAWSTGGWVGLRNQIREDTGALVVFPIAYHSGGDVHIRPEPDFIGEFDGVIYDTKDARDQQPVLQAEDIFATEAVDHELHLLNQWLAGEVFCYQVYDSSGTVESCGGYFTYEHCMESAQDEARYINSRLFKEWKSALDSYDGAPEVRTVPVSDLIGNVRIEVDGITYELASISPTTNPMAELRKVKQ